MRHQLASALTEEQRYAAAWRDRRLRVWLVWIAVFGGIASAIALAAFAVQARSWVLFSLPVILFIVPLMMAQLYLTQFRCPRCRNSFYYSTGKIQYDRLAYLRSRGRTRPRPLYVRLSWRRPQGSELGRCINCYLPLNAPRDPDPGAEPDPD